MGIAACADNTGVSVDTSTKDTAANSDTNADTNAGPDSDSDTDMVYQNTGICGVTAEATVAADTFDGFEDTYLKGDEGDGDDICRIRFETHSVGTPSMPCGECLWTFIVEKSNPVTISDVDNGCENSELQLDAEQIADGDGEQVSYGYAAEDTGHAHVLLRLNEITGMWDIISLATWNEDTFEFYYDRRDGFCGY